jgi:pimeloyl-ACP methyl ester carboxylesterase
MLWIILSATVLAAALYVLHYGYKLAFYYEDPRESPYAYTKDDQTEVCKGVLDAAIDEFDKAPFEEVSIHSHDGLVLKANYYHIADGAPVEICCHGYKGNAIRDFSGQWQIAKKLGHNLLLIDERCHGRSEGYTITFGILEQKDVQGWIDYVNKRFGNVPVILCGVSMGAATVLMVSGKQLPENVKAVIADCPFDAPSNIIKKVLGVDMGMPVKLVYPLIRFGGMLYGKFNLNEDSPVEAVQKTKLPILLIHGNDDRFVPYEMSCNIHAAAPEKITFRTIEGAGHALNYVWDPEAYTHYVCSFMDKIR